VHTEDDDWLDDLLEGLDDDARASRRRLIDRLLHDGVPQQTIRDAGTANTLPALLAAQVLGGHAKYTAEDIARMTDMSLDFVLAVRRASGLPLRDIDEVAYYDQDLEAMQDVKRLRDAGLADDRLLDVIRVLGRGLSHTAESMRQLSLELILEPGDDEEQVAMRWAAVAEILMPIAGYSVERLLLLHLRDIFSTEALLPDDREAGALPGSRPVAVCFADLVGFTRLGEELPAIELGAVADRLVLMTEHVVSGDVRFVKTIGDAVMLVSPSVDDLLEAAFRLVDAADAEGENFPQLRVGIAYGAALNRHGDWFGRPVNRASRITAIARPGTVLATESARDASGADWRWSSLPPRRIKGVSGEMRLHRARRADGDHGRRR
jgi:adenylate cyclase